MEVASSSPSNGITAVSPRNRARRRADDYAEDKKKLLAPPMTPAQRRHFERQVECRYLSAFIAIIIACFIVLKRQRSSLPHDMRVSGVDDSTKPVFHIVHIVVDDLGWADVGWRRDISGGSDGEFEHWSEALGASNGFGIEADPTPVLSRLRKEGVSLSHFYTPKDCAPSRASM